MASFGGVRIFGEAVSMITAEVPRENQLNGFFGVNGFESIDGGYRGRVTRVKGVLSGSSAAGLGAAEALFRSFNDGIARPLVDTLDVLWPSTRLVAFQPSGRVRRSAYGVHFRAYQAQFFHLA
ncbi:hypothetical protein TA3x_002289 [Tundrisphaera sp. TA3]|uniref:hypothetical protein n=1 Tax=Tundrisphaera sp. TA3 TaxID=3435775 RepID=UPI003EBB0664